jgi:hypothetical protein
MLVFGVRQGRRRRRLLMRRLLAPLSARSHDFLLCVLQL